MSTLGFARTPAEARAASVAAARDFLAENTLVFGGLDEQAVGMVEALAGPARREKQLDDYADFTAALSAHFPGVAVSGVDLPDADFMVLNVEYAVLKALRNDIDFGAAKPAQVIEGRIAQVEALLLGAPELD